MTKNEKTMSFWLPTWHQCARCQKRLTDLEAVFLMGYPHCEGCREPARLSAIARLERDLTDGEWLPSEREDLRRSLAAFRSAQAQH